MEEKTIQTTSQSEEEIKAPIDCTDEPSAIEENAPVYSNPDYEKIGGWLYLVAFGLTLSTIRLLYVSVTMNIPIFTKGVYATLTTPGNLNYHPLIGPLLIYETFTNLFFAITSVFLLVMMFKKVKSFPKFIIAFYLLNFAFIAVDLLLSSFIPLISNNSSSQFEIIRPIITCCIWIPYFLVSKRVKGTFVR